MLAHAPLFSHPISLEDGIGAIEGGVATRQELQPTNYPRFATAWTYAMLRNAANGAHSVTLVHPSWGVGVPETNQGVKFTAVDRLLTAAERAERAVIRTDVLVPELSTFWQARDNTALDPTYDPAMG